MIRHIKLLSTTLVLTLLIWVTADELQIVQSVLTLDVRFEPRNAGSSMQIIPIKSSLVKIQVSGTRRAVARAQARDPLPVTIQLAERPSASRVQIDQLTELLREQPGPLRELTIKSVQTPTLEVRIDRMIEVDVAVTAKRSSQISYETGPVLSPDRVRVRMWETTLGDMGHTLPNIEINVDEYLRDQPRDQPFSVSVPVPLRMFGADASCEPSAVRATGKLAPASVEQRLLNTVAIRACVSFENLSRGIEVEIEGGGQIATLALKVEGSREALEAASSVYGVINLREDDLRSLGQTIEKTPDFILPPGVRIVGQPPKVRILIRSISGQDPSKPSRNGGG